MSAPGIQLKPETHLPLVQPTIRQYLQSIKEAVMANNLPAAQKAFVQLQKATASANPASAGQPNAFAARISRGVEAIGSALEAGDLPGVEQALGEFRQNSASLTGSRASQPEGTAPEPVSDNSLDVESEDDSSSNSGTNLNARV